jgi:hypothetical protein
MSADWASASPFTRPWTVGRSMLVSARSVLMPSSLRSCIFARAPELAMNVFEGTQS